MYTRNCSTMATDVTLAVLDSIGSICIKAVASKIMHSVFSIMLLCLELMDEIRSLIRAILLENILRLLVHSQKTRYLSERASCLQTQTPNLIIHDYTAVSLACLPVYYCWHFAWVHRTLSEFCLVHQAL